MGSGGSTTGSEVGSAPLEDDLRAAVEGVREGGQDRVLACIEILLECDRYGCVTGLLPQLMGDVLDIVLRELNKHSPSLLAATRKMLHHLGERSAPFAGKYSDIENKCKLEDAVLAFTIAYEVALCKAVLELAGTKDPVTVKLLNNDFKPSDVIPRTTHPYATHLAVGVLAQGAAGSDKAADQLSQIAKGPSAWWLIVSIVRAFQRVLKQAPSRYPMCLYHENGIVSTSLSFSTKADGGSLHTLGNCLHCLLTVLKYPLPSRVQMQVEDAVMLVYLTEPRGVVLNLLTHESCCTQMELALKNAASRVPVMERKVADFTKTTRDQLKKAQQADTKQDAVKALREEFETMVTLRQRVADGSVYGIPKDPFEGVKGLLEEVATVLGCAVPSIAVIDQVRADGKSVVQKTILETLEELDEWRRRKEHGYDHDRRFESKWEEFKGFDWERKAKGHSEDAQKTIIVGLSEHSQPQDPEKKQLLLIHFIDTEQQIPSSTGDNAPPAVWAVSLTVPELHTVSKRMKEGAMMPLIHKEPRGKGPTPWYLEASWVATGPLITSMKLVSKMTQDAHPTTKMVSFEYKGDQIELVDVKTEAPKEPIVQKTYELPKSVSNVVDTKLAAALAKPSVVRTANGTSGEGISRLKIKLVGEGSARSNGFSNPPVVFQSVVSPKLMIMNPTKKTIICKEFTMEYFEVKGDERTPRKFVGKDVDCVIGTASSDRSGRITVDEHPEQNSFEVGAHQSIELHLVGKQQMIGVVPYPSFAMKARLHHMFLKLAGGEETNKVECRCSLKDDNRTTKKVTFEVGNQPIDARPNTYEEAVAMANGEEGIGEDYLCLLWLSVDDPITLNKAFLVVTLSKTDPEYWISRQTSECSGRTLPATVQYHYPDHLKRQGYMAKKDNLTEVVLESSSCTTLYTLADPSTGTIYGLRGDITIKHPITDEVLAHVSQSTLLDYSIMK